MKWFKFETNFWDTETADLLEQEFGLKGPVIYLRLISAIAHDIHTREDIHFAHENGWTKSIKDWARICKFRTQSIRRVLTYLQLHGKLIVSTTSTSRITIKFKNIEEFIHRDALSSRFRNSTAGILAGQLAGPQAAQYKIREEKNQRLTKKEGDFDEIRSEKFFKNKRKTEPLSMEVQKNLAKQILEQKPFEPAPPNGPVESIGKNEKSGVLYVI